MDLGGLVARNARTVPDKEAITYEDHRYDWKTVNKKVNTSGASLPTVCWLVCGKVLLTRFPDSLFNQ